jgi:hypothetical protein
MTPEPFVRESPWRAVRSTQLTPQVIPRMREIPLLPWDYAQCAFFMRELPKIATVQEMTPLL